MNTTFAKRGPLVGLALGLLLACSAGLALAEEVSDANVAKVIAAAKTSADYTALSAYFNSKAAVEAAQVKLHEDMLASWDKTMTGKSLSHMQEHCRGLIAGAKKSEQAYTALAKQYEALAKNAK